MYIYGTTGIRWHPLVLLKLDLTPYIRTDATAHRVFHTKLSLPLQSNIHHLFMCMYIIHNIVYVVIQQHPPVGDTNTLSFKSQTTLRSQLSATSIQSSTYSTLFLASLREAIALKSLQTSKMDDLQKLFEQSQNSSSKASDMTEAVLILC